MIIQNLIDFARDLLVNFLVGVASLWPSSAVDAIMPSLSIPSSLVGAFLAVFYLPSGWAIIITLLASYAALFVGTAIIKAVAGRVGAS